MIIKDVSDVQYVYKINLAATTHGLIPLLTILGADSVDKVL